MTEPLDHLVFSTRAALPTGKSSTELSREVIAWSSGVSEQARRAFSLRADITGTVLRQRELLPIFTFSRIDANSWLFCRAVSLGIYRKSSHRLLVHGVVLLSTHLERLGGNPFLLVDPEVGVGMRDTHPGEQRRLKPLLLGTTVAKVARRLSLRRLESLSRELTAIDEGFPALFEWIRQGRHVACIARERPDPRLAEWLLLHLHPDDRPEVSFHTWYTHSRKVGYQLVLTSQEDVGRVSQQFPGIALWPSEVRRLPEDGVASLVRRLRKASPDRYLAAVARYRLTQRASSQLRSLSEEETRLCLSAELGELDGSGFEPSVAQSELLALLSRRGSDGFAFQVLDLARRWDEDRSGYLAELGALTSRPSPVARIGAEQVESLCNDLCTARWPARWAAAVLAQAVLGPESDERLHRIWRCLVPAERFGELLGFLAGETELIVLSEPHLLGHVVRTARYELQGLQSAEPSYWPAWLRWLQSQGRDVGAAATRIEATLSQAPKEAAIAGFRILRELVFSLGYKGLGFRLVFQKEAPLLDGDEYERCLRRGIEWMLDDDTSPVRVLRRSLGEARYARSILAAMSQWIHGQPDPLSAWKRWRRLIREQGRALSPEVGGCGELLARLAVSSLASRLGETLDLLSKSLLEGWGDEFSEAVLLDAARRLTSWARGRESANSSPHLSRGIVSLLAVDRQTPTADTDEAFSALLFHGLIHADHVAERVLFGTLPASEVPTYDESTRELRAQLTAFLEHLLRRDRIARLTAAGWADLLLDEMLDAPVTDARSDPRYRASLHLAWRCWLEERVELRDAGPAVYRIRRLLTLPTSRPAPSAWHRRQLTGVVPESLRPAAEETLLAAGMTF